MWQADGEGDRWQAGLLYMADWFNEPAAPRRRSRRRNFEPSPPGCVSEREKGRAALRLEETACALGARDSPKFTFPPKVAFCETIAEAVASVRQRVWILAFYISGGLDPTIDAFYETRRAKAHAGLDVRVVSESGKSTPMPIRNATMNFVDTLQSDGVQVRFIQQYRVMHKKVLLVDQNKVLLGSSNLTGAGMNISNEFNVQIVSEPFASMVEADFKRLAQQAQPIEKPDY